MSYYSAREGMEVREMSKGKLELFNDDVDTILSKEDNEVFSDDSRPIEFLNQTTGTIKTKLKVEPQVSVYDVMKSWCELQQKCKDDHERFYGYYFEDEDKVYRLTGIYISNITGYDDKEVELSFNYDDKKEVWFPKEDEINTFFETTIDATNIQEEEK